MIDKQTELWFSQLIPAPTFFPGTLTSSDIEAFRGKWLALMNGDINKTGFLDSGFIESHDITEPILFWK